MTMVFSKRLEEGGDFWWKFSGLHTKVGGYISMFTGFFAKQLGFSCVYNTDNQCIIYVFKNGKLCLTIEYPNISNAL